MDFLSAERISALTASLAAAVFGAASPAPARAAVYPGDGGSASPVPRADTAWAPPYGADSAPGGTGLGPAPGRGGSSRDSLGVDTLWSSPYESPATPGTGLPGSPGSELPGTGSPGAPGNGGSGTGGSGMGGSGMGADSTGIIPAVPVHPDTPSDSIGAQEWLERG